MATIIYDTLKEKSFFDNFYKELSNSNKIKILCSIFIGEKINIEQFKSGLMEISNILPEAITLTQLFEDGVIEYLYKTCDRKDAGNGTCYYVPNENYKKIFTAFLEAYGCHIDYTYDYYHGGDECDIFNKYYHEIFTSIDMLKVYVDYIIKDTANHEKNIKSFVRTIYYMIHSLNDNIIKYIFEEFEKEQSVRDIFINSTYKFAFVEIICAYHDSIHTFMIKRLFTHRYEVKKSEEFIHEHTYTFTGTFMKECFRKMNKASSIQLAKLFYVFVRDYDYAEDEFFIYLIEASIRLNCHKYVSKKMQKMEKIEKNKDNFLANYFIQLGVATSCIKLDIS